MGNKLGNAFRKVDGRTECPGSKSSSVNKTQISTLSFCLGPTFNMEGPHVLEPRAHADLPAEPLEDPEDGAGGIRDPSCSVFSRVEQSSVHISF